MLLVGAVAKVEVEAGVVFVFAPVRSIRLLTSFWLESEVVVFSAGC